MGNGGQFQLRAQSNDGTFLNVNWAAASNGGTVVMGSYNLADPNQILTYNPTTLQIYSPKLGLCLDDYGPSHEATSSLSNTLHFYPCEDGSNPNQKFVYVSSTKAIRNINYRSPGLCLNNNGNYYNGYRHMILWGCDAADTNEIWDVVLVCPAGN